MGELVALFICLGIIAFVGFALLTESDDQKKNSKEAGVVILIGLIILSVVALISYFVT